MRLTIAKEGEYIPEWNGNKEDDEPIKFVLRHLTTGERERAIEFGMAEDGKSVVKPDLRSLFRTAVVRVENLHVNDKSLTKADDVLSAPDLYDLFVEVAVYVLAQNARQDPKN